MLQIKVRTFYFYFEKNEENVDHPDPKKLKVGVNLCKRNYVFRFKCCNHKIYAKHMNLAKEKKGNSLYLSK